MDTYVCFQTVLSVVVTMIQLFARVFLHRSKFLACDDGGWQWLHTSLVGSFFFIFHMMIIVMQSVMVEKVFYGVPHHLGWFEHTHGGMLESHRKRAAEALKRDAAKE